MFTGIVEQMGLIYDVQEMDTSASGGSGFSLTISEAFVVLSDANLGDSIAINGAIQSSISTIIKSHCDVTWQNRHMSHRD